VKKNRRFHQNLEDLAEKLLLGIEREKGSISKVVGGRRENLIQG
jgi:hypothetical protein